MKHTATSLRRHVRALDNWDKYVPGCGEIMDALGCYATELASRRGSDRPTATEALDEVCKLWVSHWLDWHVGAAADMPNGAALRAFFEARGYGVVKLEAKE